LNFNTNFQTFYFFFRPQFVFAFSAVLVSPCLFGFHDHPHFCPVDGWFSGRIFFVLGPSPSFLRIPLLAAIAPAGGLLFVKSFDPRGGLLHC